MRPTSVLVIGVLGILFGVLGLCCGALGLMGAGMLSGMTQAQGGQTPPELALLQDPTYARFTMVSAVVMILLSIWLLIGSIMFIMMKPMGWILMVAYAVLTIGWNILSLILDMTVLASAYERTGASRSAMSYVSFAVGLIYPIAVLIVATRPAVKESFQSQ